MLSQVEDFWLRWHVEHSEDRLAERARLVLEAEAGGSPRQVADSLGVSTEAVEDALNAFEHDRLAAFPRANVQLNQLIQIDSGDNQRRQHISRQAKRLFNDTRPLHHLPRNTRQLLEAAALLSPIPQPAHGAPHAQPDLNLLDGAILADIGPVEQAIIACVLHLQHKGYRADRDPVFKHLRPAEQSQVRYLSALLQIAGGLDRSDTQSTTLKSAELTAETVVLRLVGPKAEIDGNYACRKSWLWPPVFHVTLAHALGSHSATAARHSLVTVDQDELIGAVFGRQLTTALRRWQTSLPGTISADASGLNDLLSGVDQALAALGAFASVLKRRPVKEVKRPLRDLRALLAAVVEQRNALSDLEVYCSGRSPAASAELQPLREAWERANRRQQATVKTVLQNADTVRLYAALSGMAQTPPVRHRKSTTMRVAAPVLLEELCAGVAEREEMVVTDRPKTYRRYAEAMANLACVLEALGAQTTMGEEAGRLLADVQRLQNRIERWLASNILNDAVAEFLDSWAEQQARRKAPQLFGAQSVLAYRQARRAQWSHLRSNLARDWRPVRASRLRRRANLLLKQLKSRSTTRRAIGT